MDKVLFRTAHWLLFESDLVKSPSEQLINIRGWKNLQSLPEIQTGLRYRTQELELMIDVVDCNMYKNADDPTDLPIMYNAIERVTNDLSEFLQSLIDQPIERDYRINAIIAVMGGIKKHSVLAEYVVTDQHDLNHIQNSATLRIDAWTEHIDRVAFG